MLEWSTASYFFSCVNAGILAQEGHCLRRAVDLTEMGVGAEGANCSV